jgi:hypothetical protein
MKCTRIAVPLINIKLVSKAEGKSRRRGIDERAAKRRENTLV